MDSCSVVTKPFTLLVVMSCQPLNAWLWPRERTSIHKNHPASHNNIITLAFAI
uniref:Uncharacterized protein n=1 Tax=Arundo donax TaxID=35708 RepID=A0A0A9GTB7_ARUDO